MAIHLIAKELYRLIREVEALENKLSQASVDQEPGLDAQLRKLKAERNRLKGIIDGHKDAI